jgi:hypothetical protein
MTQTTTAQPPHDKRPEIQHPTWCDPGSCCVDTNGNGRHLSRQVELPSIPPNPLSVAVRLTQGTPIPGYPMSDILLVHTALRDDEGDLCDVVMYAEMARELGRVLRHTVNLPDQ